MIILDCRDTDGKQLDSFDVAQVLAKENAKKAEEEAKLKKEQERLAKLPRLYI